MSGVIYWKK